jgi:hypothetical protein
VKVAFGACRAGVLLHLAELPEVTRVVVGLNRDITAFGLAGGIVGVDGGRKC